MAKANDSGAPPLASTRNESRDPAILHWMQQLAPHGIFTTDNDLRIQSWNRWLETHSGLSSGRVLGKPLLEVFPDLVSRRLDNQYRRAIEGQVSVLSTALHGYLLPFPDGSGDSGFEYMRQTARIAPLLLNRSVCGTITTIEDVTEREIQAAALRQHAVELEGKVKERTARLDETVAQLESFSYTIAHDLRAPIRTFKGYTEILLEDYEGEFPTTAREYLKRMKRAAEGMDLLTRDLLLFSKIARQPISAEPIDLAEVVKDMIAHTPALQHQGVLVVQSPLHPVIGNRTMIQQCLSNLLDNALKFVPPGRLPHIVLRSELHAKSAETVSPPAAPVPFQDPTSDTTHFTKRPTPPVEPSNHHDEAQVRVYVEDNGIGIAPEHHRQVFGVFERIESPHNFEGTGIGLAIVARAVQRMRGRCGLESSPGQGSRFWIELPAAG